MGDILAQSISYAVGDAKRKDRDSDFVAQSFIRMCRKAFEEIFSCAEIKREQVLSPSELEHYLRVAKFVEATLRKCRICEYVGYK